MAAESTAYRRVLRDGKHGNKFVCGNRTKPLARHCRHDTPAYHRTKPLARHCRHDTPAYHRRGYDAFAGYNMWYFWETKYKRAQSVSQYLNFSVPLSVIPTVLHVHLQTLCRTDSDNGSLQSKESAAAGSWITWR